MRIFLVGSINAFNIYYNYHDELDKLNDYDFPDEIGLFSKTGSYTGSSRITESGSKTGSELIVQNKSKKKKPMSLLDRLKQKYSSPKPKYEPEPKGEIVSYAQKHDSQPVIASPDMALYQDAYDADAYDYATSYYDYVDPEAATKAVSTIVETSTIADLLSTIAPVTQLLSPTEPPTLAPPTTTEQIYIEIEDNLYFNPEAITSDGPIVFKLPPLPEPIIRSERKFERISNDEYEYYGSGDFIDPFGDDDMYTNYEGLGNKKDATKAKRKKKKSKKKKFNHPVFESKNEEPGDFKCWKCFEDSYDDCVQNGEWEYCANGQKACFIEERKRRDRRGKPRKVTSVHSGCKQLQACQVQFQYNSHSELNFFPQCFQEDSTWRELLQTDHSVCRQCCSSSECNENWIYGYLMTQVQWEDASLHFPNTPPTFSHNYGPEV